MTVPKPLTHDEHKAAEAAFRGYQLNADWTDSAQEIYARLTAAIATQRTTALNPTNKRDGAFKVLAQQLIESMGGAMPVQDFPGPIVEQGACTRLISARDSRVNRVPLGKNWRSRPFVFSFVPRSHGQWGCAK
jgi:hypothetical protein